MSVIAFRPRPRPRRGTDDAAATAVAATPGEEGTVVTGTFRSPRGRAGTMTGHLRLQRLVLVPRGAFVTGVFTGELREPDGSLVGVDSRRATVPADLVRDEDGLHPVVRPVRLDLMGIAIEVPAFAIEPALAFPRSRSRSRRSPSRTRADTSRRSAL
jgi:hypothetical protein